MEDDLDAIVNRVEEVAASDVAQDGIGGIVDNVVRRDRRKAVTLQRIQAPFNLHLILFREQFLGFWHATGQARVVHPLADRALDVVECVTKLLGNGVASKGLDVEVICLGRENEESDNRYVGQGFLEEVIEPCEGFNKDISSLVTELVPARNEEVQRFVEVEVKVSVEVTSCELVNLILGHGVKVLELVQGRKLLNVQAIRCDDVWLPLQQMFRFEARDFGHSREDMRQMR